MTSSKRMGTERGRSDRRAATNPELPASARPGGAVGAAVSRAIESGRSRPIPRPTSQGRGESSTSGRRLDAAEKQLKAVELRRAGWSFREIADALGYAGPSGAFDAVHAAIEKALVESVGGLIRMELDRLDAMTKAIWERATQYGDVYSIDRVLKIMERRAKLLGIDAAEKRELSGPGGGPIHVSGDLAAMSDDELDEELERIRKINRAAEQSAAVDDDNRAAGHSAASRFTGDGQSD